MKRVLLSALLLSSSILSYAQLANKIVNVAEVTRIQKVLSADSMKGRNTFSVGNDMAADFISKEFKKIGLLPFSGEKDYKQKFTIVSSKPISISASFDNTSINENNVVAFTCLPDLSITEKSGFKKVYIKAGDNFSSLFSEYRKLSENLIVFVDTSFSRYFPRLARYKQNMLQSPYSAVFVLGNYSAANTFAITAKHQIQERNAANVVGILPGKRKKGEFVIFSAHYDHIGVGKAVNNDSIYNGANDDASGVAAVILMAKYYKAAQNNQRTLVFVAFTAEEIGGFGSQYFSNQLNPEQVKAMFNIEMIGTESKWGKNSAYITGFDKSSMGKILQKNLKGSKFMFYPDPYTTENLFYRSDNATLALLGVPAHTISTSKMDNEPNYHKVSDEIGTLDLPNMTEVIKAVIKSSTTIVSGADTPTRVSRESY